MEPEARGAVKGFTVFWIPGIPIFWIPSFDSRDDVTLPPNPPNPPNPLNPPPALIPVLNPVLMPVLMPLSEPEAEPESPGRCGSVPGSGELNA